MSKSTKHIYSAYSQDAMNLLGMTIRTERKLKKMTEQALADRAGVSRSFINRVEKGDMSCRIGAVFEIAYIVGIPLFDVAPNTRQMKQHIDRVKDKLTLLPKTIHKKTRVIDDDF
jgi:transcriptional regulator with XRE-family HTH domain